MTGVKATQHAFALHGRSEVVLWGTYLCMRRSAYPARFAARWAMSLRSCGVNFSALAAALNAA